MSKWKKAVCIVLSILLWIGLWTYLAYRLNKPVLLPYPKDVAKTLFRMVTEKSFLKTAWGSFAHVTLGFLCAFVLGILLGFLSSLHEAIEILLMPGVKLIKTVPVVSFIILLLFFVKPDKIGFVISLLMVFPVVYENARKGIAATDRNLLETAKVFRFSFFKKLAYIILPSAVPFTQAACSAGLGLCWKAGIAAELIAQSPGSIGHELYYSKLYVDAESVFAWTIVIIVISVLFEKIFLVVFRLLSVSFSAPTLWHHKGNLIRFIFGMQIRKEEPREDNSTEERSEGIPEAVELCEETDAKQREDKPVCELIGVDKYYDGKPVLKNVNLTLYPSSVTILTGPSGCGKTTLLRILLGLTKPDGGERILSSDTKLSAVFQENRLCEQLSASKNVRMVPGGSSKAYANELLRRTGIEEKEDKPVSDFSGGMRRRVAWCRGMAVKANLFILDEPFTGLDDERKKQLMQLLLETEKQAAIVIVTHITSEIEEIKHTFPQANLINLAK